MAKALASRARAERVVEAEESGLGRGIVPAAAGAAPALKEREDLLVGDDAAPAHPLREGRLDRVEPPRGGFRASNEAVDHDVDRSFGNRSGFERDDLIADADARESVLAKDVGQRLSVGFRSQVEREGDQVSGLVGKSLDRLNDRGRARRLDAQLRNSDRSPRRSWRRAGRDGRGSP